MFTFTPTAATARLAKNPEFAAELVSIFNDRLEEARTEIGDAAAQAAHEADGWAGNDMQGAVAELLAAHAEVETVEPVVPDGERYRPHPVGPDANADAIRWKLAVSTVDAEDPEADATAWFRLEEPDCRTVGPNLANGQVEVYDNAPVPGRHLAMQAFEQAVFDAGGVITFRFGSRCAGESRDCYPHAALGRPDGDGWTLYYLIGLLSPTRVKELVEEHFGPLDVLYGGDRAA